MHTVAAKLLQPTGGKGVSSAQSQPSVQTRVVLAAAAELGKRGIEATSIQHILEASGVSRRTYYKYFADKNAVLNAILDRSLNHFVNTSRAVMFDAPGGHARLQAGFDVYIEFARRSPRLILLLSAESQRHDSPLMATRLLRIQQLEDLYREAYEDAEGQPLDSLFARSLVLLLESLTLDTLAGGKEGAPELGRTAEILSLYLQRMLLTDKIFEQS